LRGPAKAAHHTRDASTCSAAISTLSGRGLYLEKAIDLEIMAADEPDPKLKASLLQIVAAHRKLAHETLSELAEFGSSWKRKMTRLGSAAKMPFGIHPHMLRHSTGFKLANQGVDTRSLQHYLGHKNIQHTVRYSELSPERFRDFWKD
jgi:integrase